MKYDLTTGSVSMTMLKFSLPMILGNLMQQLYNISDTLIVGHFIGTDALAAVGASYALIIFLTSVLFFVWVAELYFRYFMVKKIISN